MRRALALLLVGSLALTPLAAGCAPERSIPTTVRPVDGLSAEVEILVDRYPGSSGFLQFTDHVVFASSGPDRMTVACGNSSRLEDAEVVLTWLEENAPVPVHPTTWGRIKSTYGEGDR